MPNRWGLTGRPGASGSPYHLLLLTKQHHHQQCCELVHIVFSIGGVWFSGLEGLKMSMSAKGTKIEAPRGWGLGSPPRKIRVFCIQSVHCSAHFS